MGINLKGAKAFEFEERKKIVDGQVYLQQITGVISSLDADRDGYIDKKTGKTKHWVMIQAKVIEDGQPEVRTSHSVNWFEDTEGLNGDQLKQQHKDLKTIEVIYETITGETAPDDLEIDELFLAINDKTFASKVFSEKVWEVTRELTMEEEMEGKETGIIGTQLTWKEKEELIKGQQFLTAEKVDKLTESKDKPGQFFKTYRFSGWLSNLEEHKNTIAREKAMEESVFEEPATVEEEPSTQTSMTDKDAPWEIDI